MPVCRWHGMHPCPKCLSKFIILYQTENEQRIKQGRTDLHDVDGLRRELARIESNI